MFNTLGRASMCLGAPVGLKKNLEKDRSTGIVKEGIQNYLGLKKSTFIEK